MEMIVKNTDVKSVLTKANLLVADYSVNPYTGCEHGCKYCYASFMKRFTKHPEPWGSFVDVKHWPDIKRPFNDPPIVVNYFFHEEIIPSAKKKQKKV